ncbi:MAG: DUF4340 domain-containing protein [Magnetococcus sp. YQC-3]
MSDAASMTKQWRINLLLLLLLLAVAATLWWLDRQEAQRLQGEKVARTVSTIPAKSVVRVQWWRAGTAQSPEPSNMTLMPQAGEPTGRWQISTPSVRRTNSQAASRLLEILGESYDRKVTDNVTDPVQFGLDQPAAVLTVHDAEGHALQLTVGRTAPASKKQYLQIGANGPVVLFPAQAVSGLLQNPDELRDKKLFAKQTPQSVQQIVLTRPSGPVTLKRGSGEDKLWRLTTPVEDLASENRMDAWLQTLLHAQGSGFSPLSAAAAFKERPAEWTLLLESGTGEKESVQLQRVDGKLLAWRDGEPDALVLENYLAEELEKPAMELIALQPLGSQGSPMELQVTHQGKTLTSTKKEGKWPKPIWTGIEEVLTRDAWRGVARKPHGEPWLTIMAFQEKSQWVIPFWKEGDSLLLAPPNRPVDLELTHYQAEAFMENVKALFAPE